MFKLGLLAVLVLAIGIGGNLKAQDITQHTKELVASLDKTKYKKKDKGVVQLEFFSRLKMRPL